MSKKRRFSREFKEALLREHDETGISYWKLGKKYQIDASTIRRWRNNAKAFGTESLEHHNCNLCNYAAKFKKQVVEEHQKMAGIYIGAFLMDSALSLFMPQMFLYSSLSAETYSVPVVLSLLISAQNLGQILSPSFTHFRKEKKGMNY